MPSPMSCLYLPIPCGTRAINPNTLRWIRCLCLPTWLCHQWARFGMMLPRIGPDPMCAAWMGGSTLCLHLCHPWGFPMGYAVNLPFFLCCDGLCLWSSLALTPRCNCILAIWYLTDPMPSGLTYDLTSGIVPVEDLQRGLIWPSLSPLWLWLQRAWPEQCRATEKPAGIQGS